jgi:hypothetical protein
MKIGEIINWISFFVSIASFILTLWALWKIRKLRKFYVLVNRGPELLVIIREQEENLSKLMIRFNKSLPRIKLELGDLLGNLSSLQKLVNKPLSRSIERVILLVEQYNMDQAPSREHLVSIRVKLRKVLREVENAVAYERSVR